MENMFSAGWKGSKQPRKQRKYRHNAPLHIRSRMVASNLAANLRKKYGVRSVRLRTGDKVRIMRGQFKGKEGKVEKVDLDRYKIFIEKAEVLKKDGSKTNYPIDPSNVMVTELNTEDKRRMKKMAGEEGAKGKAKAQSQAKSAPSEAQSQAQSKKHVAETTEKDRVQAADKPKELKELKKEQSGQSGKEAGQKKETVDKS
ncbi:50S ribosomal protein L24 [Candidatus Woesearchaeota archaeon]|nr:50S ribosomal protein L24 [Candidatus Woesearchaeota archaeon]